MKNFDWTKFSRKLAIEANIQSLYDAWIIPAELERWFLKDADFTNAEGKSISKSQRIKIGDTYKWQWHLWDGTEEGKITKVNGKDHLQFTFAGNCLVDVHFEIYEKGTIVSIAQSNIPTDDDSKQNIRLGCDNGWSFYIVNLKSVYEGGLDLRNKDPKLKPMLNN
ncbi:uncharacterized protein YndB with AHSA1/START domain [Ulvibacter sp. MAR_2010_11]|uniref:SRPBCC family protein n=1 Tax=Ulvibacter sp. MAR_2010_11 TaxID=1250229 RepID=UPI000C2C5671|nr:SRPBCC domain-containing protein [Ulvibacter sp. MAR_2010_11]PKA83735.1 uncharacterized protein YndB with AHSA1/START domain [Ulvibacter sp. MAR_2010_11]